MEIRKDKATEQDSECCELCLMEFIPNQFIYRVISENGNCVVCSKFCAERVRE